MNMAFSEGVMDGFSVFFLLVTCIVLPGAVNTRTLIVRRIVGEGIQTLVRRKKVLCALHASLSTLCSLLTLLLLFPISRTPKRRTLGKLLLFFVDVTCKPSKICRLLSAPIYITLKAPSDLVQDLEKSCESRKKSSRKCWCWCVRDALRLKACCRCRCDFNMLYADVGRRSRRLARVARTQDAQRARPTAQSGSERTV